MVAVTRHIRTVATYLMILGVLTNGIVPAYANPEGGVVVGGSATIAGQGTANVTINQSTNRAAINWDSFSIDAHERTQFIQPDRNSVTLNRVTGADPSRIMGTMTANGTIILTNPNGVVFGKGSKVDAAGLVATTHDIGSDEFMAGGELRFNKNPNARPDASVINEGDITIHDAGVAALVAPQVRNGGLIVADGGTVNLASGQGFALDIYGDGMVAFGVDDETQNTITDANGVPIKALIENSGDIKAGKIILTANTARQVVNQAIKVTGKLDASHVSQSGGKIIISSRNGAGAASGIVNIGDAQIKATGTKGGEIKVLGEQIAVKNTAIDASGQNGGGVVRVGGGKQGGEGLAKATTTTIDETTTIKADATQTGGGGNVVVWSEDVTDYKGSISAKGGTQSGNGGFAEVSGKKLLKFKGQVDLSAANGATGDLLLDPQNITIQAGAGSPAANCTSVVCEPGGDSSVLLVSDLQNLLLTNNVTVNTGASGAQAGNITVADSLTWATANRLLLDAYGSITINGGVTISNTYSGSMVASTLPVLLALRADATGINNGGSFTNNGTIDFSGSTGAVSIFYDRATYGGSYTAGTQTANGSWAAPTNLSVNSQFTAYQLINTVTDLAAINAGLSGNYALGKNIDGLGAAFNSDTPMGAFTGRLDGQYCQLSGGANCGVTNLTMTPAGSTTAVGLFASNSGVIRNLSLGLSITQNYTIATANNVGTLAGSNSGTIANVLSTGAVDYTYTAASAQTSTVGGLVGTNTGTIRNASTTTGSVAVTSAVSGAVAHTTVIGGLVGQQTAGTITNSNSSQNVSYVYKGTSTGTSGAFVGGLVGGNTSTTANSIFDSSASGTVGAGYFSGFSGNVTSYVGGLVGRNGNNTATSISNVSATGNVSNNLNTITTSVNYETVGGLIGWNYSTLTTQGSPSVNNAFATGTVTYNGTTSAGTIVGGLIGYNQSGWINGSYATGATSYTGTNAATSIGGLIGNSGGGISNSYATGNVSSVYNGNIASTSSVGGLVGYTAGNIISSYSQTGAVTATSQVGSTVVHTSYIGGLVGQYAGTTLTDVSSTKAVSYVYKGTSTGTSVAMLGGLIGYTSAVSTLSGTSFATGNVTAENFSGFNGNVTTYAGGLIGQNGNNNAATITGAYATGNVTDTLNGGGHYAGGLIGYNYSSGTVSGASATGNVSYNGTGTSTAVGGFVGYDNHASGNITNSTSSGTVANTSTPAATATSFIGGFAGRTLGTLTGSYSTNTAEVSGISQVSGTGIAHTYYIGGQVGYLSLGSISNLAQTANVSYVYKGTSTGASIAYVGGLVGYNASTTTNSILNSSNSGTVTAGYFSGFTGNVTGAVGGLIGQNGGNTAVSLSGVSATGNVSSSLSGGNEHVGGLIGLQYSSLTTSGIPSITGTSFATGSVTYNGTTATSINVGGLIGYVQGGWINNVYATGAVSVTSAYTSFAGGLIGNSAGGVSNSYATGNVSNVFTGSTTAYTSYAGGLIGSSSNIITDSYTQTGTITVTSQVSGTNIVHSSYAGGLVGQYTGSTLTNVTSTQAVSYVYKGTSTGTSVIGIGGLVGYTSSISTLSGTSSASGNVTAENFSGFNGNVTTYAGGLIGQNGNANAAIVTGATASGSVTDTLNGAIHYVGGLIGYNNSTGTISGSSASGAISYNGTGTTTAVGGFVGFDNQATGSITNNISSGTVANTSAPIATSTSYIGGFAGRINGTLTNSYSTNTADVSGISQVSGTGIVHTYYVGGQVGWLNLGSIANLAQTANVSYVYRGTSTGTSVAYVGGLVGYNVSTTANSISNSSNSGAVTADYFSGFTGNVSGYIGGLVGQNGNNTATSLSVVSTSGNISSTLTGGTEYVGGLIGWNYSNLTTSVTPSINNTFATGSVVYTGASGANVGGLIGYNQTGWINLSYATGAVSYTGAGASFVGGLTARGIGGISNSYATGNVTNTYTGTTTAISTVGGLVGQNTGNISDSYTQTGTVTATSQISGTATINTTYIGGLAGNYAGQMTNSTSSQNVSYVYQGTSTGTSVVHMGGLIGWNIAASNSVSGSSASGAIAADYFSGFTGNITANIGGLIGQSGNATAVLVTGSSATGNVSSTLRGGTQSLGGLIGYNYSTLNTVGSPSVTGTTFAIGDVTYNGTALTYIGGLIGNNTTGWVNGAYATGAINSTTTGGSYAGGLIGNSTGGISSSYATGVVNNNHGAVGSYAGGLIGSATGTINSSYAIGNVNNIYTGITAITSYVGGLAGYASGIITNSYSQTGAISGTSQVGGTVVHISYIGGLVGNYAGATLTDVTSTQAVSYVYKGTSTGTSVAVVGGLVGFTSTASTLSGTSFATGNVTAENFSGFNGNVTGYIGGLVGQNGNITAANITNAYASGQVIDNLNGGIHYVGGLIGYNRNSTGTVSGSTASGNVSYSGTGTATAVGGFIGAEGSTGFITNNTSTGSVSSTNSPTAATTSYIGGFAGLLTGTLSGSYSANTAEVSGLSQVSGTGVVHTYYVGGQVGYLSLGSISNLAQTANVSYVYKGTSTGTSVAYVGGLVGYNVSTTANSILNSSNSGTVTAGYFSGFTGNVTGYVGGLVGQNGNSTAITLNSVSATGNVISTLQGGTERVGGLIGWNYSTLTTAGSPAITGTSFATGNVSYTGSSAANVGGLIGYNQTGWINGAYASGSVSYSGTNAGSVGGLIGNSLGGVSNSYATGAVSNSHGGFASHTGGLIGTTTALIDASYATGNVESLYTGTTAITTYTGGLVGLTSGNITSSYSQTGTLTATSQVGGTVVHTSYIGGLVGQFSGSTLTNVSSTQAASYVYKGTSTGTSFAMLGGLIGYISTASTLSGTSYATGNITAENFSGYTGSVSSSLGGLIGLNGANTVTNVTGAYATGNITDTLSSGNHNVGGFIGQNQSIGTISDSSATGNVSYNGIGVGQVGGFIGYDGRAAGSITNNTSSGTVSNTASSGSLGGFAGYITGTLTNSYTTNTADVIATALTSGATAYTFYIGGQVGYLGQGSLVNVTSTANVSYVYKGTATGTTTNAGAISVGGLVGVNASTTINSISGSSSTGNVTAENFTGYTANTASNVGGLVGSNGSGSATSINSSFATGNITNKLGGIGPGSVRDHNVGGLIGFNNTTATILNSYATGNVTYDGAGAGWTGGFVGYDYGLSGTISGGRSSGTVVNISAPTSGTSGANMGAFAGYTNSTLIDSYSTSTADVVAVAAPTGSAVLNFSVGGQVGYGNGTITNLAASQNVSYVYKGTSTGAHSISIGGLLGGHATALVTGSSATGIVTAGYEPGYTGNVAAHAGGLIGYKVSAAVTNSYATGNVNLALGTINTGTNTIDAGGLIGWIASGGNAVTNTYATGNVNVTSGTGAGAAFGGLIGYSSGSLAIIDQSYATGDLNIAITGNNGFSAGGLIGCTCGGTITNSYAITGTLTVTNLATGTIGTSASMGGLTGQIYGGYISNSYSTQNLSYVYKGTTTGLNNVGMGGLVANYSSGNTNGIDATSYATGNLTAENFAGYTSDTLQTRMGGLIGQMSGAAAVINGAYATGDVTDTTDGTTHSLGGFVGVSSGTITGATASGDVHYKGKATDVRLGGFAGNSYATIVNSTSSGETTAVYTGNSGTGYTYMGGFGGYVYGGLTNSYSTNTNEIIGVSEVSGTGISKYHLGGQMGWVEVSTLSNISNSRDVTYIYKGTSTGSSTVVVGGISGESLTRNLINLSSTGDITARYYDSAYDGTVWVGMGGIIGENYQWFSSQMNITDSFSTGKVTNHIAGSTGGLVGNHYATGGSISNSYATGDVTYAGSRTASVGGLLGSQTGSGTLNGSYATGNVIFSGYYGAVGGLIGWVDGATIANAYALGVVNYTGTHTDGSIGGLVGNLNSGQIQQAYSAGYVQTNNGLVGGLVGTKGATATVADSYWDIGTTGHSISAGGTGLTTAQLQAALQNNFSSSTWGILAGISYPYLNWQVASGTPQIVSGRAYSDLGGTGLAGESVAFAIDGTAVNSALTGGDVYTGANGYYYYFLAPNTISGSGDLLAYLPGTVKANSIYKGATGSVDGFNLYGNTLNIVSGSSTLSSALTGLSGAMGAYSGSDFVFTLPGGNLALNIGANLAIKFTGASADIDTMPTLSGGGSTLIASNNQVTQSTAITTDKLVLDGTGSFNLTNSGNQIGTLAGRAGTLNLNNGSANLSIGSVLGVAGFTANDVYLQTTGQVSQTAALSAGALSLAGTGGLYNLTNSNNRITRLAANTGRVDLNNGGYAITVGSVNGYNGINTTGLTQIMNAGQITLNNTITAGGSGNSLVLSGSRFTNNAGANALNAGSGRFLVWSTDPANDTLNGLSGFKQYSSFYGITPVNGSGNGFLYMIASLYNPTNTVRDVIASTTGASQLNQANAVLATYSAPSRVIITSEPQDIEIESNIDMACSPQQVITSDTQFITITCANH